MRVVFPRGRRQYPQGSRCALSAIFSCDNYLSAHRNGTGVDAANLDAVAPLSLDALDAVALASLTSLQLAALSQRLAALQCAIAAAHFQTTIAAPVYANGNQAAPISGKPLSADEAAAVLAKPRR